MSYLSVEVTCYMDLPYVGWTCTKIGLCIGRSAPRTVHLVTQVLVQLPYTYLQALSDIRRLLKGHLDLYRFHVLTNYLIRS